MFRSSALHLFMSKYNQKNPCSTLPPLCVIIWAGRKMEREKKKKATSETKRSTCFVTLRRKKLKKAEWRIAEWFPCGNLLLYNKIYIYGTNTTVSLYCIIYYSDIFTGSKIPHSKAHNVNVFIAFSLGQDGMDRKEKWSCEDDISSIWLPHLNVIGCQGITSNLAPSHVFEHRQCDGPHLFTVKHR